jgi:hypothetical protein
VLTFTGTQRNQDELGAPPFRCGAALTVNIRPDPSYADGMSNLGSFSVQQSHCIVPPPPAPFYDGVFEWTFDLGGSLFGTYSGTTVLTDTPGIFGILGQYVISGGTGPFGGAMGAFMSEGTLRFVDGRPTAEQRFDGSFVLPGAVPEPDSWALLIAGFGLAGAAMRFRRKQQKSA